MALDKQKILSELNSVVNQLQSADCGCMGKLFSNSTENNSTINNPIPSYNGCGHGGCHSQRHICGIPCAGEPCAVMNKRCMRPCNSPQLYADTYNYLNSNLMQPVVQEVYNDLKSITPANTVFNNPVADHMGLSHTAQNENNLLQNNSANINYNATTGYTGGSCMQPHISNGYHNSNQQRGSTTGMGPQIVNMMMGGDKSRPSSTGTSNGEFNSPSVVDTPQSLHGKVGVAPLNPGSGINSQMNDNTGMSMGHHCNHPHITQNSSPNYISQQHVYGANTGGHSALPMHMRNGNTIQNNIPSSQQIHNMNANPVAQGTLSSHQHPHGQHALGIAKFNEMFPGVTQGNGGDLNFDPMKMAIQMNPDNQQKGFMNTFQKVMNDISSNKSRVPTSHVTMIQPAMASTNIAAATVAQNNQVQQHLSHLGQAISANQVDLLQKQINSTLPNKIKCNTLPQQFYTEISNNNNSNQQKDIKFQEQYQQEPQPIIDSRPSAPISPHNLSTVYEETIQPGMLKSEPVTTYSVHVPQAIKEPISDANTSEKVSSSHTNKPKYEYNTLGQPVEMLDPKMYYTLEQQLPQTLAPQHTTNTNNENLNYSNVKSTVSKTSLSQRRPVGKNPSRSQLQNIYNQYKDSQSYTQQNIKEPAHGGTHSVGNLREYPGTTVNQAPVERVGDTQSNNQNTKYENLNKVDNSMGNIGDVPVSNPINDVPKELRGRFTDDIETSGESGIIK